MGKLSKWVAIGVAAVGLVGLAACGKQSAKAAAPVKITYWHRMTGSWNTAQQHLIDEFNHSQKQYKVVAQSMGSYDALQQKIMAAAKSKTLPTIAQAPYTNIGDYVKAGFLAPFSLPQATTKAVYPSFLAAGQYQDKQYGMPYSVSTQVLFVNSDLVKKYQLKVPTTWADIEDMGPKLKQAGLATVALDSSYDVALENMAEQSGSKLITGAHKANLASSTTLAAVNQLLQLRKAGILTTAGSDGYFSTAFNNQKAVFGIASSASIPILQQQAPKSLHWTTAPIPGIGSNREGVLNGNYNVLFKTASKKQQAGAAAFTKFLLKADNTAYWAEKSGYVPVTQAGVQSARYQKYLTANPAFKAATDAAQDSFASTVFAGYSDYRTALLDTVDQTLTKQVDGNKAFKALQAKTETILAQ